LMDVTRPISNILPPPAKRNDGGDLLFGRRNASADENDLRVEEAPSIAAHRRHAQDDTKSGKSTALAPVKLQDIQATFVTSRETHASSHIPYSSPFLAQQLAQQDSMSVEIDPAQAHRRAASAYDSSLSLTVTLLGFDGHAERIA